MQLGMGDGGAVDLGLEQIQEQGYDYELVTADAQATASGTPDVLASSRQRSQLTPLDDPVELDASLYDLKWRLRLVPSGGWSSSSALTLKVIWAALFCGATSGLVYLLAQRMQLTRSLLQNLTDHVPGVLYQYRVLPDGSARFQYLSPGIEALVGLRQEELARSDRTWRDRLLPQDKDALRTALKQAAERMAPFEADFRLRVTNGDIRWFWTRAQPQKQNDGSVVWHGYLADWTTEKQTEDALIQSSHLLTEAQEVARLGYFFTDVRSGRWSSSALLDDILGIGSDFERTAEGWNRLVDPAYRDSLREAYQTAAAARTGFNIEYPLCRPVDGRMIWVHLMGRLEFDDQGRPTRLVGTLQDISARKKAEADIRSLAYYDPLTGLPNRRLLLDRLSQALLDRATDGQHGALMFIDLDHFKQVNDQHGHATGDALLAQCAQRLRACTRAGDTVARLGGDEFVVMVSPLPRDEAAARAQLQGIGLKLREALAPPYHLPGLVHRSTPSIGAVLFRDEDGPDEVLGRADAAMYQAKRGGRDRVAVWDPGAAAPDVA